MKRVLDPHGAKMTWKELRQELARRGLSHDVLDAMTAHAPPIGVMDAEGTQNERTTMPHMKCPGCGELNPFTGSLLDRCHHCGWCRHPAITGSKDGTQCVLCGEQNVPHRDTDPEHFKIHHVDQATGKTTRTGSL